MATIDDLAVEVLQRLEDPNGVFWNRSNEINVLLWEAMSMATLITGEPEVVTNTFTITANQTLQTMPAGMLAIVGMTSSDGTFVLPYSLEDLGNENPNWENETSATLGVTRIQSWFPYGLTKFGVYPKILNVGGNILNYTAACVQVPVDVDRPFIGNETIPFQNEYLDGIQSYAEGWARLKEDVPETLQGLPDFDDFLKQMSTLSKYAERKGSLRFTTIFGPNAGTTRVEER